jgi:hypothetical protein
LDQVTSFVGEAQSQSYVSNPWSCNICLDDADTCSIGVIRFPLR